MEINMDNSVVIYTLMIIVFGFAYFAYNITKNNIKHSKKPEPVVTQEPEYLLYSNHLSTLKVSYATKPEDVVTTANGKHKIVLTPKQLYLIRSFFNQYTNQRVRIPKGNVKLFITNHLADTFVINVSSQQQIADRLNSIFGIQKSLSSYVRIYSKTHKS
jgi:hypothetical protein